MQPILFNVQTTTKSTFHLEEQAAPHAYHAFHYHPEVQLTLVRQGCGTVRVGDIYSRFETGNLYLIGSNTPHAFIDPAVENQPQSEEGGYQLLSLFFKESTFSSTFFQMPELAAVSRLFVEASQGIKYPLSIGRSVESLLLQLRDAVGIDRIVQLLNIFHVLTACSNRVLLANPPGAAPLPISSSSRMHRVFDYIARNFHQPITLEEIADYANLSKYAFCRYFKRITNKSFVAYLNEFRTGRACKLLAKEHYSVSQIGALVGFNNLSNFNRQFKKFMHCTPSTYRKWLLSGKIS